MFYVGISNETEQARISTYQRTPWWSRFLSTIMVLTSFSSREIFSQTRNEIHHKIFVRSDDFVHLVHDNVVCLLCLDCNNSNMFKALFTFGLGVYTGIYLSQNYEIPRVDEPAKIIERIKEFANDHKKK